MWTTVDRDLIKMYQIFRRDDIDLKQKKELCHEIIQSEDAEKFYLFYINVYENRNDEEFLEEITVHFSNNTNFVGSEIFSIFGSFYKLIVKYRSKGAIVKYLPLEALSPSELFSLSASKYDGDIELVKYYTLRLYFLAEALQKVFDKEIMPKYRIKYYEKITQIIHDLEQRVTVENQIPEEVIIQRLLLENLKSSFLDFSQHVTDLIRESNQEAYEESARVIAHELRNSLSPIKTFISRIGNLTEGEFIDKEKIKRYSDLALSQVDNLFNFANSYLEFARMNKLVLKETQIIDIINEVVGQMETNFPQCEFSFEAKDIPDAQVDPILLQRAFNNIITNSIEAMSGKGHITISMESDKDQRKIKIIIKDSGHGIRPGDEEKIFELGYTTRGESRGKGLGLAIVSRIIQELHQGTVNIENNESQPGVTVTIAIPSDLQVEGEHQNGAASESFSN